MIIKSSADDQRERMRLEYQIAKSFRAAGRTWTEADMRAAIDAEMARRHPPRPHQLALPGMPAEAPPAPPELSTKAESFEAYQRSTAANRKVQIYDLLDKAGPRGMTREEIAETLGVRTSDVCQEVYMLISSGEACEPFKRLSHAHRNVWVVVLAKHGRQA